MQINVDTSAISKTLLTKLRTVVQQVHNSAEVHMENISRRVWVDILDGLKASRQFKFLGQDSGCTYTLENGTIAQRSGDKLSVTNTSDMQAVSVDMAFEKHAGVFTVVPRVTLRVCTVTNAAPAQHVPCKVVAWQYFSQLVFANSRGYEYVLRIVVPPAPAALAGEALCRCEMQQNRFLVRHTLKTLEHSCLYHAVNSLSLFRQVFSPALRVVLSTPRDPIPGTAHDSDLDVELNLGFDLDAGPGLSPGRDPDVGASRALPAATGLGKCTNK